MYTSNINHYAISDLFLRVLFSFFPSPPSPSVLNPSPSRDLKTPPFSRGNATFRDWGAARGLEGVTTQEKTWISLKHGAKNWSASLLAPKYYILCRKAHIVGADFKRGGAMRKLQKLGRSPWTGKSCFSNRALVKALKSYFWSTITAVKGLRRFSAVSRR